MPTTSAREAELVELTDTAQVNMSAKATKI